MLRFDTKPNRRTPGVMSRGLQLRLIMLVVGLGVVLATMSRLGTPEGANAVERFLRADSSPSAAASEPPDSRAAPSLLTIEQASAIKDNTFFRREETEAWFAIFRRLKEAEPLAEARGPFSYAQLTKQPHIYRGRPVRVAGALRRAEKVPAGENDLGIDSLYRLILQGSGGEAWPTTLYTLTPPEGVALGEPVDVPIEAVGVFFKNWSYRWSGGLGITPVILTQSATPLAAPPPTPAAKSPWSLWSVAVAAGLIALLLLFFVRLRSPAAPRPASSGEQRLDFSQLASQEGS